MTILTSTNFTKSESTNVFDSPTQTPLSKDSRQTHTKDRVDQVAASCLSKLGAAFASGAKTIKNAVLFAVKKLGHLIITVISVVLAALPIIFGIIPWLVAAEDKLSIFSLIGHLVTNTPFDYIKDDPNIAYTYETLAMKKPLLFPTFVKAAMLPYHARYEIAIATGVCATISSDPS